MTTKLEDLLLEELQRWAGVGQDPHLLFRRDKLNDALRFIEATPGASKAESELRQLMNVENWSGDAASRERFFQLVGEAQFWLMATDRSVALERINEGDSKSPDFRLSTGKPGAPCFEVKTLSVAGGTWALDKVLENVYQGQLDIERQRQAGELVASAETSFTSHGNAKMGQEYTTMARNLLGKIESNIKAGQFSAGPTVLVVNTILIDAHSTDNSELGRAVSSYPAHTGVFWTVAFGELDQDIQGYRAIEGKFERQGLLVNYHFSFVRGIIFIVHPLREPSQLYAVCRHGERDVWQQSEPELYAAMQALVGTDWNDEQDSNRAALAQ